MASSNVSLGILASLNLAIASSRSVVTLIENIQYPLLYKLMQELRALSRTLYLILDSILTVDVDVFKHILIGCNSFLKACTELIRTNFHDNLRRLTRPLDVWRDLDSFTRLATQYKLVFSITIAELKKDNTSDRTLANYVKELRQSAANIEYELKATDGVFDQSHSKLEPNFNATVRSRKKSWFCTGMINPAWFWKQRYGRSENQENSNARQARLHREGSSIYESLDLCLSLINRLPVAEDLPPSPKYPISKTERDYLRRDLIRSLDTRDVQTLASRHRQMEDCVEFRASEHGSFNVCFFVEFPSDNMKWVVRFPIQALVHNPWEKLQSEVATLEYLRQRTTIPVPKIYGFGPGGIHDTENPTGMPFVILEYMSGRPLAPKHLQDASPESARKFYSQLADILGQLRQQEFDHSGCLTAQGAISPLRSVDLNSLQLCDRGRVERKQSSAIGFVFSQYHILCDRLNQPVSNLDEEDALYEVFALHDVKQRLVDLVTPSSNEGPFVLTHGDLRPENIIVKDDLSISAIIDWEWSCTVPVQFFAPPVWLGGIIKGEVFSMLHRELTSLGHDQLAYEWGLDKHQQLNYHLAASLLHHQNFVHVYYRTIFPQVFEGEKDEEKIAKFFSQGRHSMLKEMATQKVEASRLYKQHLLRNGLLSDDEREDKLQLLLDKVKGLVAS